MESCVRGCHVYQTRRAAIIGEDLECRPERRNATDSYAVAVIKDGDILGHLPR